MRNVARMYAHLTATVGTTALISVLRLQNANIVTNSRIEMNSTIRHNYNNLYHYLPL